MAGFEHQFSIPDGHAAAILCNRPKRQNSFRPLLALAVLSVAAED
jgi:hypothetical protein